MEKFDQQKYKNAFNREKYENIVVRVPAGSRNSINVQAREKGFSSTNAYILDLIQRDSKNT